jgi:hypothetical protein
MPYSFSGVALFEIYIMQKLLENFREKERERKGEKNKEKKNLSGGTNRWAVTSTTIADGKVETPQ